MERKKRLRSGLSLDGDESQPDTSAEGLKSFVAKADPPASPTDEKPTNKKESLSAGATGLVSGINKPASSNGGPATITDGLQKMAAKADDYDAVFSALDDAGSFVRSLWISFVSLGTYLVVVVWSVTHKQLFLDTPIKLPLVDVNLPLYGFFLVAPLFFLIMHGYLLMQLVTLTNRLERYNEVLSAIRNSTVRRKLRQQLSSFVLIQFLSTPGEERKVLFDYLLPLVAWLTIVVGPLFFFLLTQWRFLPYQDEVATWAHRLAVMLDLALLWVLWSRVLQGRHRAVWPQGRQLIFAGSTTAVVLALSLFILTFPGERIEQLSVVRQFHDRAVSGSMGRPEPRRWVKGTLELAELDVVEDEELAKIIARVKEAQLSPWEGERTFRINGPRSLRFANLQSADLRRTDLRNVRLDGADLDQAKMDGALLDGATFGYASLRGAQLEGASLNHAHLEGADLVSAHLKGASLNGAHFEGADLGSAQLQGASLYAARLQGADLGAQLQGAILNQARLQGADLGSAHLEGASLDDAELQGASLNYAHLEGASLDDTHLQGAVLSGATLQDASLNNVLVFRTSIVDVDPRGVAVYKPVLGKGLPPGCLVEEWISAALEYGVNPYAEAKKPIEKRLRRLLPGGATPDEDAAVARFWTAAAETSRQREGDFQERLAMQLAKIVCSADNAPYVARGLIRNNRLEATGRHLQAIASQMKKARGDPARPESADLSACPGVKGFIDKDWSDLDEEVRKAGEPVEPPHEFTDAADPDSMCGVEDNL